MSEKSVQDYPSVDSPSTDPFEALVEAYYQRVGGYITASAKWFWVRDPAKRQRGYQDIDVLAINALETVIVSVTGNLEDKVTFAKDGSTQFSALLEYFERVELHLIKTPEYEWLVKNRSVKRVLAYANGKGRVVKMQKDPRWVQSGIELLYSGEVIDELHKCIADTARPFKTNNQLIKLLQINAWRDRDLALELAHDEATASASSDEEPENFPPLS